MDDVEASKRISAALERRDLSGLSDEELVSAAYRNSLSDVFATEVSRRQLKASSELKTALEKTSGRLYALTVVLTIYSVALLVVAIVAALLRR